MNHMDKVCNLLGLELFEKFNITKARPNILKKIRNPYYFTDEGMINNFGVLDNDLLADLIVGSLRYEIIHPTNQNCISGSDLYIRVYCGELCLL